MRVRLILSGLCLFSCPVIAAENDISLREYVDTRFEAQEKAASVALAAVKEASASALAAADRAVAKAEAATDKRFEGVNEFRAALNDSARLNMPRAEAEQQFKAINEKIEALTVRVSAREEQGRGLNQGWVLLIGIVAVAASLISIYVAFGRRRTGIA